MQLGPATKTDKINKGAMTSFEQIVTSLSFFRFMDNLEQSGSRILDA